MSTAPIYVNPESMAAAAYYVQHNYGPSGYTIAVEQVTTAGGGIFAVRHFDGGTFRFHASLFGGITDLCDRAGCLGERVRTAPNRIGEQRCAEHGGRP